jgi:FkbM family methyltransferase
MAHIFSNNEATVHLVNGGVFRTPLNDAYWVRVVVGWRYEPEVERAISAAHVLIPYASLLDCGANRGYWGARFANQMQVIGVEAVPSTYLELVKTAADNNFIAIHGAVWSQSGVSLDINWNPEAHAAASLVIARGSQTAPINTVTIYDLYHQYVAPHPAIIKLDVEGAELEAIRGGLSVLEKCLLIYEDHGNDNSHRTTRMLSDLGNRVAFIDGSGCTPVYSVDDLDRIKTDTFRGYNFVAWKPGGLWDSWFDVLQSLPPDVDSAKS